MLGLFKLGVALALGLAVTQQVVNVLDARARISNRPQMERAHFPAPPLKQSAWAR